MVEKSTKFFVLIDAGDNDVGAIRSRLLEIENVVLVHCPLGPDDLLCYVEVKDFGDIHNTVLPAIHKLLEAQHNPILHTETLLVLEPFGSELRRETNNNPQGIGAWILANVAVSDSGVAQSFLRRSDDIIAVYNVIGRYDTIIYTEAPDLDSLHKILDEGIRNLRAIIRHGTSQVLQKTDTRLVLNYESLY